MAIDTFSIDLTNTKAATLEPVKKNRWIVKFTWDNGTINVGENFKVNVTDTHIKSLAFAAHTVTVPSITFNANELNRLNDRVWVPGKSTYNDINIIFYDYIKTPNETYDSATEILHNWSRLFYDPATGQAQLKQDAIASVQIIQLSGSGKSVRQWNLHNVFPLSIDFGGSLSYADDTPSEVNLTIKYDWYDLSGGKTIESSATS